MSEPHGQLPKLRAAVGDFRPLERAQLSRGLNQDLEMARQVKKPTMHDLPRGWRGSKAQEERDVKYERLMRIDKARVEREMKANAKEAVELKIAEDEINAGTQLMREMEEEEKKHEKQAKQIPISNESTTTAVQLPAPGQLKARSTAAKSAGDWLTKTAIARNNSALLARSRAAPKLQGDIAPLNNIFEIEDDDAIAREMAAEEAASRRSTPAPVPQSRSRSASTSKRNTPCPTSRSSKGRRQFSALVSKPAAAMAPPPTPRDPPPSTQPTSAQLVSDNAPSSTPLTVKRARKPLFFQEKPEDREESVVTDSKLQADRDEQKRKEIEAEQKRQDAWLRELCSTQAVREIDMAEGWREEDEDGCG